jgi:hypothetical protein
VNTFGNRARDVVASLLLVMSLQSFAWGQQPAPADPAATRQAPATPAKRELPPADELEPAVDTSATALPAEPSLTPAPAATPPKPDVATKAPGAPPARPARAQDRLELDATQITGNRELPKVLYIVPWKRSDLGDLMGRPVNSLLDEVLSPVDRDVFRRENRYYRALQPQSAPQTPPAPSE